MGAHASVLEKSQALSNYNLKQKRICAEFTITGNASPGSKTMGFPDLPGVFLLRTQGQTSTVDAIETVAFTTADDGPTNSVFGVLIRGGNNYLGNIEKVLFVRVTDRSGSATSYTVTRHGTYGLTTGGNIAFSIAGTGLNLESEDADVVVEIEYVSAN